MPKPGLGYQDLVAKIESAIDPGADVAVGKWVEGPDGKRELDVAIGGTGDGKPFCAFIECKDWAKSKKVGIEAVDALHSKRDDLRADFVGLYSNSGFTAPAVQKARRVGIGTFTAVATGDGRSRARANVLAYGRVIKLADLKEQVFEPPGQDLPILDGLDLADIRFENLAVHNWVVDQLDTLIAEHACKFEPSSQLVVIYQFDRVITFDMKETPFPVIGLRVNAEIQVEWMAKVMNLEVEVGRFDAQTGLLTVPAGVPMTFFGLDNSGWEPIDAPNHEERQGGDVGLISVGAVLQARLASPPGDTPDISRHVVGTELTISLPVPISSIRPPYAP